MAKSRPVFQLSPPFTMSAETDETTQPEGVQEKRQRQPSRKALQNMIQSTTVELSRRAKALRSEVENVYTALRGNTATVDESALQALTQKYKEILTELECLYAQDKWGDISAEAETVRQAGFANLEEARTALNKAKSQCYEDDRVSRKSQHSSRVSSSRSSRSSTRAKALAEAAAANKQAEYDRIIAEKQHLRRQQEATYERDMALLAADKLAAVADAKLAAIENCIQEEERSQSHAPSRKDVSEDARHRTEKWVDAQNSTNPLDTTLPEASHTPNPEKRLDEDTTLPFDGVTPLRSRPQ
ncbi:flotillin family inner membrane protein sll1021-like [Montipora foliosa]|uniref:flotillin family inner membrane protein sll1021-like n=1 Tax=Montipora foliosa TaxID=591990 RepID=UPI0035F1777D